jgi:signal transduction histidine kinase
MGAKTALVVPMMFRNRPIGFLSAFDHLQGDRGFTEEDERLMQAFAASAATAVATAQSADAEALRRSLTASEEERRRWARELHDETLQEMAGLKVLLSGARRSDDVAMTRAAMDQSLEIISNGIANLRSLITELRPAALDEIGTQPALEAFATRLQAQSGVQIDLVLDLAYEAGRCPERHTPEIELTAFRLVQEALNNTVKHAGATRVNVRISELDADGLLTIEIQDDGRGFDPDAGSEGFGLLGMRERVASVGGTVSVTSEPGAGTLVSASLPVELRATPEGKGEHPAMRA